MTDIPVILTERVHIVNYYANKVQCIYNISIISHKQFTSHITYCS